MKSQDILLLLKLISLKNQEILLSNDRISKAWPDDWRDWDEEKKEFSIEDTVSDIELFRDTVYSTRFLEQETGVSKTQVSESLRRCADIGLVKKDRKFGVPRCNYSALFDLLSSGVKYFFPAKPGALVRGISTAFAAPVLQDKLLSAGDLIPVWPDAMGHNKGLAIEPIYKTVPHAVKKDPELYAMLALVDAIRVGQPREANLAKELLKQRMGVK